jgi:hypothetical protein
MAEAAKCPSVKKVTDSLFPIISLVLLYIATVIQVVARLQIVSSWLKDDNTFLNWLELITEVDLTSSLRTEPKPSSKTNTEPSIIELVKDSENASSSLYLSNVEQTTSDVDSELSMFEELTLAECSEPSFRYLYLKDKPKMKTEKRSCLKCSKPIARRATRNKCQTCGDIFCGKCSSHRTPVWQHGCCTDVHVCHTCYKYSNAYRLFGDSLEETLENSGIDFEHPRKTTPKKFVNKFLRDVVALKSIVPARLGRKKYKYAKKQKPEKYTKEIEELFRLNKVVKHEYIML